MDCRRDLRSRGLFTEWRNENNENGSDRENIYICPACLSFASFFFLPIRAWQARACACNAPGKSLPLSERASDTRARTFQVLRLDSFSFAPGARFFTGR